MQLFLPFLSIILNMMYFSFIEDYTSDKILDVLVSGYNIEHRCLICYFMLFWSGSQRVYKYYEFLLDITSNKIMYSSRWCKWTYLFFLNITCLSDVELIHTCGARRLISIFLALQTVQGRQENQRSLLSCYAVLLGLMGTGMSGYSLRQLAMNYLPSVHQLWKRGGKVKMTDK